MLAMTLAKKTCGPEHVLHASVGGALEASKGELRAHLAAFLDPAGSAAPEPRLSERHRLGHL
jgi:hypothetical protein